MDIRDLRDRISYPCRWSYRLIGRDEAVIRAAVDEVLGQRDFSLVAGNRSRHERWISMTLELVVQSEEQRLNTFHALMQDERLKFVL